MDEHRGTDPWSEEQSPDISAEPSSKLVALGRRLVLGFLALTVILSMLSNLLALPETLNRPSRSDLGLTEVQVIERYGQPDNRSEFQTAGNSERIGLAPQRLQAGEQYFSLSYREGPLTLIFHFVAPQTYQKYNAYRPEAEDWVVLERFVGTSNVIY